MQAVTVKFNTLMIIFSVTESNNIDADKAVSLFTVALTKYL